MQTFFITGATGLLGAAVLQRLDQEEIKIIIGSRKQPAHVQANYTWQPFDLDKTNTINLSGVDTILHLASNPRDLSLQSDITGTKDLLRMARNHQVKHFVYISIVGIDTIPIKYYKHKKQAEELIKDSGLEYTILRATQFFEFTEYVISQLIRWPLVVFPNLDVQPIDTAAVAKKLVDIGQGQPLNRTAELGGPEILSLKRAIKDYLKVQQRRKLLVPIPKMVLGKMGRALTTSKRSTESSTWQEYLKRTQ